MRASPLGSAIGALAPFQPADGSREIWRFYQQAVFNDIHHVQDQAIASAYLDTGKDFRRRTLPGYLGPVVLRGRDAWNPCRAYLNDIEAALAARICRRATTEWLHLYRRLGVALHPFLGGKVDSVTTILVREIAELAMAKHGATRAKSSLALSGSLKPKQILGGLYLEELIRRRGATAAKAEAAQLIASNQLVMTAFSAEDIIDLYRIESLAYEYWRTTAALRAIGKGAGASSNAKGDLDVEINNELADLLAEVDARTGSARFSGSLIGSWFHPEDDRTDRRLILAATYNPGDVLLGDLCDRMDIALAGPARETAPNFDLAPINWDSFAKAHRFMDAPFEAANGFPLLACGHILRILSGLALSPLPAASARRLGSLENARYAAAFNIAMRGYAFFGGDRESLASTIENLLIGEAKEAESPAKTSGEAPPRFDRKTLLQAIDFMTLTPTSREQIGLWSHGRRYPLIPIRGGQLVDFDAIGSFLHTLYAFLSDDNGNAGIEFEKMWREALKAAGYDLALVGKIKAPDGTEREVDAGVRIGSTLFLMECRSTKRRLDYEIGNPEVLARRQSVFDKKLEQVETLRDFLIENAVGRNYDVSWAVDIAHFVVGPFEEFIWSRDSRFWEGETPRIISADAMLERLDRARHAENTAGRLPAFTTSTTAAARK